MGFKLDKKTKDALANAGKKRANELADEVKLKLMKKYNSLIDFYYDDYEPKLDKNGNPYYIRTFNLYKSYRPYKRNSHDTTYYGGVEITSNKMNDYINRSGDTFYAKRLLDKYIYTTILPSATWHGGDWHGGYGVMAQFSIYDEMKKYQNELIKAYSDNK